MEDNKHLSEDKEQPIKIEFNEPCGASWQLYTNGSIGKLKCRICGVYVMDGGTPKCKKLK